MNMFTIIIVITVFLEIVTALEANVTRERPRETLNKCGLDKSPIKVVYEGNSRIETYPWIGILFYKNGNKVYSTTVVLVTLQIVVGSALDIDRLPKSDFRSQARVVLGHNCSRPGIKIRDYSYHPDFNKDTYSSVALIQLETNFRSNDFYPVCAPPKLLENPQFYVLTLSDEPEKGNCAGSPVFSVVLLPYIGGGSDKPPQVGLIFDLIKNIQNGIHFSGSIYGKMWPTHTICARALSGKECIWKNGAILLLRQENKWSLIGLGIQGPGCRAPSRFLDYVQHRSWLRRSMAGIGQPTVTRISRNHLVLRRSLSNVQRYGPCDLGEIKAELYTDRTTVHRYPTNKKQRARYNFTILANMEYSCVVFRVFHYSHPRITRDFPYIRLHRWCMSPEPICSSFQFLQIDFRVTIWFKESVTYHVAAYGQEIKVVDMKKVMVRVNRFKRASKWMYYVIY